MNGRIDLANLKFVKGEFELPGNSTSVRGEYYIPQINKTAFFKQNGCMLGDTIYQEDLTELFATRIMDIIGTPHAQILLARSDLFGTGCLSVNILEQNEHFVEPKQTGGAYSTIRDVDDFINRDLTQISSIPGITSQDLSYRKNYLLKYLYVSALISNTDVKMDNMLLVKNEVTGRFRNPEYYDMGIAFSESNRVFFGRFTSEDILQQLYEKYPSQIVPFGQKVQERLTRDKVIGLANGEFYNRGMSNALRSSIIKQLTRRISLVKSLNSKEINKFRYGTNNLHEAYKNTKVSLIDNVRNYLSQIKNKVLGGEGR